MDAMRRLVWALLACAGSVGCSGTGVPIDGVRTLADGQARSSDRQALEPAARSSGNQAQQDLSLREEVRALASAHGELITIASSPAAPQVALAVTFKPGDEQEAAQCPLVIYERRNGVVAEASFSDVLLSCALETSAAQAGRHLEIELAPEKTTVSQQFAKSHTRFQIARDRAGTWRVVEAEFTTPQSNPATGEVRVLTARARYPTGERGLALADYSYERLEKQLVQEYVD